MVVGIIFSLVIGLVFGSLLIYLGKRLFSIASYESHYHAFKKQPKKSDWFDKYFLGFALFDGLGIRWSLSMFGDTFLSGWYRFSGILFILFGIFFILSSIATVVLSFLA